MNKIQLLDTLSGRSAVWIEGQALAQNLLLSGQPFPWLDVPLAVQKLDQLVQLTRTDVLTIDLGALLHQWLENNLSALQFMQGKKRIRYALKQFLSFDGHRQIARELISATSKTLKVPLVLDIPDHSELVRWAHHKANGAGDIDVTDIDIDTVSVYLADYLRVFSEIGLAGILLNLPAASAINDQTLELYSAILNVARHYRWAVGVRVSAPQRQSVTKYKPDFMLADQLNRTSVPLICGQSLNEAQWGRLEFIDCGHDFIHLQVPSDCSPEALLDTVSAVRSMMAERKKLVAGAR